MGLNAEHLHVSRHSYQPSMPIILSLDEHVLKPHQVIVDFLLIDILFLVLENKSIVSWANQCHVQTEFTYKDLKIKLFTWLLSSTLRLNCVPIACWNRYDPTRTLKADTQPPNLLIEIITRQ